MVTSDRGLCGGFNGNIARKSSEFVRQCEARGLQVNLSIVGRKGRDYFRVAAGRFVRSGPESSIN